MNLPVHIRFLPSPASALRLIALLTLAFQTLPLHGASERDLEETLAGTKWHWQGRPDFLLELRADGTFALDAWAKQGIEAEWEATGPKEVTVTVTSRKFHNLTATLIFDADLTSFTGTDLDKNRKISRSPRA